MKNKGGSMIGKIFKTAFLLVLAVFPAFLQLILPIKNSPYEFVQNGWGSFILGGAELFLLGTCLFFIFYTWKNLKGRDAS